MPIATARPVVRRRSILLLAAVGWSVGGFIAMVATWPPPDGPALDKAVSLLLLVAGMAMASICWIGVSVLAALDDLRNATKG